MFNNESFAIYSDESHLMADVGIVKVSGLYVKLEKEKFAGD